MSGLEGSIEQILLHVRRLLGDDLTSAVALHVIMMSIFQVDKVTTFPISVNKKKALIISYTSEPQETRNVFKILTKNT